jgi:hypothetical protein
LQALASYAFAKSIDVVSEESFQNRQSPTGRFDPRLYIGNDSFAGGKRFNPAAFDGAAPLAQGRQGTLGRNVLRGFGASQFLVISLIVGLCLLTKAVEKGASVVIASHDQAMLNALCHRALSMRDGKLCG